MDKDIVVQSQLTPDIWKMVLSMALQGEISKGKRFDVVKKLIFCHENQLPYNLAFTGGIFLVPSRSGDSPRLGIEGIVIRAQLRKHPDYDYEVVKSDMLGCTFRILRKVDDKWETEGESTFTHEDAKRIEYKPGKFLIEKDNHKNYPQEMYLNRATAKAQRVYAPDLFFKAVYIPGEFSEIAGVEDTEIFTVEADYEIISDGESVITLNNLAIEHGADAVLEANDGVMPASQDDIDRVAKILEGENNDE